MSKININLSGNNFHDEIEIVSFSSGRRLISLYDNYIMSERDIMRERREKKKKIKKKIVHEDIETNNEEEQCCICMTNKKIMAFVPCGHMCTCYNCSEKVKECPLCKENIETKMKIYQ